jgi:hypothetical protein
MKTQKQLILRALMVLGIFGTSLLFSSHTALADNGPTISLSANPTSITSGQAVSLSYSLNTDANCVGSWQVLINNPSNPSTVYPTQTTDYTLTCTDSGGTSSKDVVVYVIVTVPTGPTISLSANPTSITSGQAVSLSYSLNTDANCVGSVPGGLFDWAQGYFSAQTTDHNLATVYPTQTTDYTLTCTDSGGTSSKDVVVYVSNLYEPWLQCAQSNGYWSDIGCVYDVTTDSDGCWFSKTDQQSGNGGGEYDLNQLSLQSCPVPEGGQELYFMAQDAAPPCGKTSAQYVGDTCYTPTPPEPATISVVQNNCPTGGSWSINPGGFTSGSPVYITPGTGGTTYSFSYTPPAGYTDTVSPPSQMVYPGDNDNFAVNCTKINVPSASVTLTASPTSLQCGNSSTLTWTGTNVSSCNVSPWSNSTLVSGTQSVSPTSNQTYSVSCVGLDGTTPTASASVTVGSCPVLTPTLTLAANGQQGSITVTAGTDVVLSWAGANITSCSAPAWTSQTAMSGSQDVGAVFSTRAFNISGLNSSGTSVVNASVTVNVITPPTPTATMSNPVSITAGQSTNITWSSTNTTSCVAWIWPWTSQTGTSGSVSVSPNVTTTYGINCTGAGGNATAQTTVNVTASPTAPTVTLTANPTSTTPGGSSDLTWSSTNATSCSANGGWTSQTVTSGSEILYLARPTQYTMTCTGAGGSAHGTATVTLVSSSSITVNSNIPAAFSIFDGRQDIIGGTDGAYMTSYTYQVSPLSSGTVYYLNADPPGYSLSDVSNSVTGEGSALTLFGGDSGTFNLTYIPLTPMCPAPNQNTPPPNGDMNACPGGPDASISVSSNVASSWTIQPGNANGSGFSSNDTVTPPNGGATYSIIPATLPVYGDPVVTNSITGSGSSFYITGGNIGTFYLSYSAPSPFVYSLQNSGTASVEQGNPVQEVITKTFVSGTSQPVSLTVQNLPSGVTVSGISSQDCTLTCDSTITLLVAPSVAAGSYYITVDGDPNAQTTQFELDVTPTPDINVTCTANPSVSKVGQNVNWTATAMGGSGSYTSYSWSGTDIPTVPNVPTSNPYAITYSTVGSKNAVATVTDSFGKTGTCTAGTAVVNVNPTFQEF